MNPDIRTLLGLDDACNGVTKGELDLTGRRMDTASLRVLGVELEAGRALKGVRSIVLRSNHALSCDTSSLLNAAADSDSEAIGTSGGDDTSSSAAAVDTGGLVTLGQACGGATGAFPYNRPCAQQYVGKSQSCMVISGRLIVHAHVQVFLS